MALSNWDTLALLGDDPTSESFVSPMGIRVDVYKNWIYIRDELAWREGGAYMDDVVAELQYGHLQYMDISIQALRGPQDGVYAVVTSGSQYHGDSCAMVACGVYGFEGDDWVGVLPDSAALLRELAEDVLPEGHALLSDDVWQAAMRFNQGDKHLLMNSAVLRDAVGEGVPASRPGEAVPPLLVQVMNLASEGTDDAPCQP